MVVPEGGVGVYSIGIARAGQWGQCSGQTGKDSERAGRLNTIADSLQQPLILLQRAGCWAVTLPLALALQQLHVDWWMVAMGFGNGLAASWYDQAIAIRLSPHRAVRVLG